MTTIRPGFWCDTFAHPAGLGFAYCTGPSITNCRDVIVEVNGTIVDTLLAPETPRMLRACASPTGALCLVGQGQDGGGAIVYQDGIWRSREWPCYAMPAVSWDGAAFVVWLQVAPDQYMTVTNGERGPTLPIPIGVTASGIRQVVSGTPVWCDSTYTTTVRGTTLLQYMLVEGIYVGQSPDQPYAVGTPIDVGDPFVALDAQAMDPRVAYSPAIDAYAVCSWTTSNTAAMNVLPPFPALPAAPPVTPPIVVPPEPPVVVPPEPPVVVPPEPPVVVPPEPPIVPIVPIPPEPPVQVGSTGGVILMVTPTVTGLLQHYGIFKDGSHVCLRAESPSSTVCYSVQPDGTVETRPSPGGSYEFFVLDGQIASCRPVDGKTIYSFVIANVVGQ